MWNPVFHKYTALPRPSSKYDARHVGFGSNHLSGNLDDFRVVIIFANENAEVTVSVITRGKVLPVVFLPVTK